MRNTTKLKAILQHYHADFSMEDQETFILTLFHKTDGSSQEFRGTAYTSLIGKAYTYCNKYIKTATSTKSNHQ